MNTLTARPVNTKCILDCVCIFEQFLPYDKYDFANAVPCNTEIEPVDMNDIPTMSITIKRSQIANETIDSLKSKLEPIHIIAVIPAQIVETTHTYNNGTTSKSSTVITYFTNKL